MMNKTVNIQKEKLNFSLVDQRPVPPSRGRAIEQQSVERSRIQVCMETSQAERYAGINVSYENSFSAIRKDILKETVDKKKVSAFTKEIIPIEEKPNKPKDKFIVKNMEGQQPHPLNLTQEVKPTTAITVEDMMSKSTAQYGSSRSGRKNAHATQSLVVQSVNLTESTHQPDSGSFKDKMAPYHTSNVSTGNDRPKTSHMQGSGNQPRHIP